MIDGYWHKLKKKWSGDQANWANWPEKKSEADWACHICDSFEKGKADTYEGNYGSEKYCRECGGHKGVTNHMTMAERWEKIAANSFLPREEAKAERVRRKENNDAGTAPGVVRRWGRVDANGGEQAKNEAIRDHKAQILDLQLSGEITLEEAARRIQEGPPMGTKGVTATGAADGSVAPGATDPTQGFLELSWKEIAKKLSYKRTTLHRLKNDPDAPKEMIEHQQKLIKDLEAKRDSATPTPARLAQFDQKIKNAEWYQEQAEAKLGETIENITYYQEQKVEEETELQKTVEEVEKMKKEKRDFMLQAGIEEVGKKDKKDEAMFELFSPEVANIMKNMQKDTSTQANELRQACQMLHGYAAAKVEARNAGEWDEDESDDDSGDESDEEIVKGMVDIRQVTALLPTQANAADGSTASDDPTAGVIFSQGHIDLLNARIQAQEKQIEEEAKAGNGRTKLDNKSGKDKDKKDKSTPKKKIAEKQRSAKKETGTTPTKKAIELDVATVD